MDAHWIDWSLFDVDETDDRWPPIVRQLFGKRSAIEAYMNALRRQPQAFDNEGEG